VLDIALPSKKVDGIAVPRNPLLHFHPRTSSVSTRTCCCELVTLYISVPEKIYQFRSLFSGRIVCKFQAFVLEIYPYIDSDDLVFQHA
jgi:hypothetical protein